MIKKTKEKLGRITEGFCNFMGKPAGLITAMLATEGVMATAGHKLGQMSLDSGLIESVTAASDWMMTGGVLGIVSGIAIAAMSAPSESPMQSYSY